MLIARAPLRLGLAGGGTDLPAYYERDEGLVVSTTIDKFVYARVDRTVARGAQIVSADYQTSYLHRLGVPMCWDGDLALPRAILHEFDIQEGVSVFIASEVPPGTGLGSSSAAAVALVQVLAAYQGRALSRHEIAELACKIELEKLAAPIGKQDQFAAAFGGVNVMRFSVSGVSVEPVRAPSGMLDRLNRRLLLFFTGTARSSATILRNQQQASARGEPGSLARLHRIRDLADACHRCIESGDLDGIGEILHEGWQQKRALATGITTERIDELYEAARRCGARGGKITGAGGGGFLLLYCQEDRQPSVVAAMEAAGLRRMDFSFEPRGVMVSSLAWHSADEMRLMRVSA
ncbi:MAG: GHMP kinase [Chloroflexi bacterium]|nr:GHMP kinase [Chloroflexota bacterium]